MWSTDADGTTVVVCIESDKKETVAPFDAAVPYEMICVIKFYQSPNTALNARSRSAMMSSTFSIPMERRMVFRLMP